jgi:hypothetical protein
MGMTEGLHWAKIMHSLISIDLGNAKLPNLLLTADNVQWILNGGDDMNRKLGGVLNTAIGKNPTIGFTSYGNLAPPDDPSNQTVPLNQSYALFSPKLGPLGMDYANTTTLFAQYLCSVPQPKNTGNLLVAMLIADLVVLHTAWQLLNWGATNALTKRDPSFMACQGCLRGPESAYGAYGAFPMETFANSTTVERKGSEREVEREPDGDSLQRLVPAKGRGLL